MTTNNLNNKLKNHLMTGGNKTKCEKIIRKSVKFYQKLNKKDHKDLVKGSIIISSPPIRLCEIKKKKKKNKTAFPYVVRKKNRISLGIKSVLSSKNNPVQRNLFKEMASRLNHDSEVKEKLEENYKLSLKFKKSAFFRWFF